MISDWLTERLDCSLHPYQLACLLNITRVSHFTLFTLFYSTFAHFLFKKAVCIAIYGNPSHNYGVSLAVWDHTVLPPDTSERTPPSPQPDRLVLDLSTI